MSRRLSKIQYVQILDTTTLKDIELGYIMPDPVMQAEYAVKIQEMVQDKDKIKIFPQVRVEFGKKIITAIPDGYFTDENGKAVSSNINNENYREDWKDLLEEHASDLLADLALRVFEAKQEAERNRIMQSFIEKGVAIELASEAKKKISSQSS
jgi:hypothetical protein